MTTTNNNEEKKDVVVVKDKSINLANKEAKELLVNYDLQKKIKSYLTEKDDQIKFMSALQTAFYNTPRLAECTKVSLMNCAVQSLTMKLFPDGYSGIAWIPYTDNKRGVVEAKLSIDYTAYITILGRAGIQITSNIVYKNDEFLYEEGDSPRIIHRPNVFDKGEAIGVYAISTDREGRKSFKVMSKEEVLHIKEKYSKDKGFWENDPQLNMWKKTAIRQLIKFVYKETKNQEIEKVVEIDNENDGVLPIPTQTIQSLIKKIDKKPLKLKESKVNDVNDEPTEEEKEYLRKMEQEGNEMPNVKVE